jgi:HK97 family phage portal protein
MSFWSNFRSWFGGSATRNHSDRQYSNPSSQAVKTGKTITEDTALQQSAVWASVKLLSETVSSLPIKIYEVDSNESRTLVKDHPVHRLLHVKPNGYMTPQEFKENMMLNLALHGNCYATITRNGAGTPVSLNPIAAQQTNPVLLDDGSIVYEVLTENSTSIVAFENMLHIKLFGNGLIGLSPLAYGRVAIGLGVGAEEYASNFFINGGKPSGILTLDRVLNPQQRAQVKESFIGMVEGSENSHRMMLLEAGMQYQPIQMNPNDLQMIETRKFQIEDIARFFGVPSFLINDTSSTTTWGSGIEQMMRGFYSLTLKPYLNRWEQALERKLLTVSERRKLEIEFDFDDLLRGDSKGRSEYFAKMVQNGIWTRNEARQKEKLKRYDGADKLTAQVNLAPLEKLGETIHNGDSSNADQNDIAQ